MREEVAILTNEPQSTGRYNMATGLVSSVYFVQLMAGNFIQTCGCWCAVVRNGINGTETTG